MKKWMTMVLFLHCTLSSNAQNWNIENKDTNEFIRYLTFPVLDSLLTELYPSVIKAAYPIAILKKIEDGERYSKVFSIYITDYDDVYERKARLGQDTRSGEYASVQRLSNRFIMINNRKIPVYLGDFDATFYAYNPRDSLFKRHRQIREWHGYIVVFDMRNRKIIKVY